MYHQLSIIGYLGSDPELRFTPTGKQVCSFSVAANRKWKDNNGQVQEQTVWFRIHAWGKLAETANQYLAKGRQVFIKGELSPDPKTGQPNLWQGNDGQTRASYEVRAAQIKFLGKAPNISSDAPADSEDEIPFS